MHLPLQMAEAKTDPEASKAAPPFDGAASVHARDSPERRDALAAYDRRDGLSLEAAINALLPPDDGAGEARAKRPKLYVHQLNMIGEPPAVVAQAAIDYAVATEMNWVWAQRNINPDVIRRYRQRLYAKYEQVRRAHPADEEHPERNREIGCAIYDETMKQVAHLRTHDGAIWVNGTSEGHLHHMANDESDDPTQFVKWHPAYDQETGT